MTQTVVVAGAGEYQPERTMLGIASDLERTLGHSVTYCIPDVLEDMPTFPKSSFGGLEALENADLLVIFTRWRRLPSSEMQAFARYLSRGGPVLGLRTASHAFRFDADSEWASWNVGFGRDVLGTPWVRHHGHTSRTRVWRVRGKVHPILDGVEEEFESRSWLYQPHLAAGCDLLLQGEPIEPEILPVPGPVAWTRSHWGGGRVFYTSLGHEDDFEVPSFRALLRGAAAWCVGDA